VDYEIPASKQVSGQLRDLLKRMLVADPNQRANLLEIEQHPWFRKDIPPDLVVGTFNANYLRLSDSAEHANTIRRQAHPCPCLSSGDFRGSWLGGGKHTSCHDLPRQHNAGNLVLSTGHACIP